jgi:hypothetical protein
MPIPLTADARGVFPIASVRTTSTCPPLPSPVTGAKSFTGS